MNTNLPYRKTIGIIWFIFILIALAFYFLNPDFFNPDSLIRFLGANYYSILTAYLTLSILRSILLLPSTIFVFLGIALYPDQSAFVICCSIFSILIGASLLYKISEKIEPHKILKIRISKIEKTKEMLNKYGFLIIIGWAFFPFVPTDLICIVAGNTRYNFLKFISAIFVGELILVTTYVYAGQSIFTN